LIGVDHQKEERLQYISLVLVLQRQWEEEDRDEEEGKTRR